MCRFLPLFLSVSILLATSCNPTARIEQDPAQVQLFHKVDPENSGVTFVNEINESLYFNAIIFDNMMTGGGVGLLDVNNDGLLDIFFAGNQVEDALYLNKGGMRFENITRLAGIEKRDAWTSGVAIADVNGDGWDDIYLCKHVLDDPQRRLNMYYENQRNGRFVERAAQLGIADPGYSTVANFFDYDVDGDLDLYVGNQPPSSLYERPKIEGKRDYRFTDRLYRNDGDRFTEVTALAGVVNFCYTLSVNVSDFNGDHLPDIYVAADYEEPDHMYINQGNGTFRDVIHDAMRHLCNFSMGTDIADINNDGHLDIFTADMVAADHYRNKTNMSGMNPEKFWALANHGYHYQYMFNALQLNNGNGTYSEIAQLAGVSHTDWSWAAFFVDVDHDTWQDLFVANGQLKDIRNKDFDILRTQLLNQTPEEEDKHHVLFEIARKAPVKKLQNYVFRNNGDLTFGDMSDTWGLTDETWSQGAAFGDLDNDGDMDLVISNTNDPALIYENQIADIRANHYLRVRAEGPRSNHKGIGARVEIQYNGKTFVQEITPIRGYMSSVEPVAHFGVGKAEVVDAVKVTWPGGYVVTMENVPVDQTVVARFGEASLQRTSAKTVTNHFRQHNQDTILYAESVYDDYAEEILLPYRMSTLGPVMASADVNGDNLDDFYLGGSAGNPGILYIQGVGGRFVQADVRAFTSDKAYEDGGANFFDADGDRDLDLYVCSGSNEFPAGSEMYQDRLYINDGRGSFTRSNALPRITESTSVAVAMDYDQDGDTDIFVGARQVPGAYGRTPRSMVLRNTNGKYEDVGREVLPAEGALGMVTDAHWVQMPGMKPQMVVAGEWMALQILEWDGSQLVDQQIPGTQTTEGMWNRILPVDIDNDGDIDIVAGNCGKNLKYSADPDKPFTMMVNDFDDNGTNDVYLGYYDKSDGKCYPVRGRECSSQQMPFVKKKFASYSEFANATIHEVLEGKMDGAQELNCRMFASGIFENTGGELVFRPLPNEAQFAPVYGIVVADFNEDGNLDLFLAGNYYHREVETTRSDAGIGTLLIGKGEMQFDFVHPSQTGIVANRDVRGVALLRSTGAPILAIANNGSPMQFYTPYNATAVVQ